MSIRSLLEGRSKKNSDRRDRKRGSARRRNRLLRHEVLEDRRLLSTTPGWMFSIGGSSTVYEESHSIAVGADGDVYVSGRFGGTVDFDPSAEGIYELTALDDNPYGDEGDNFIAKYSSTGELLWAHSQGSFGYEPSSRIALDSAENVYFAGYQVGQAHLDGVPMVDRYGQPMDLWAGYGTVFIKFDSDGNFQWAQQLRGDAATGDDVRGINIAVHDGGTPENPLLSIYLVGQFSGTVDFDPAESSTQTLSCLGEPSDQDVFVAKYDGDGDYQWAQRAGNPASEGTSTWDRGLGVGVDTLGNAYAVGSFSGTADFGDYDLTAKGFWDGFIAKLNVANGTFEWAHRIGGDDPDGQDVAGSVVTSTTGEIYVGSRFFGTADFGTETLVSLGSGDGALSKLDSSGNFVWTRQFGAGDLDSLSAVALDTTDNVYAVGYFSDSVDFDPGSGHAILTANQDSQNIYLTKVDSYGNFLSARRMGGTGGGMSDYARGVQVFDGDIYTTGTFVGDGDFDTGTETVLQTASVRDVFVVKTTQERGAILGRVFMDSSEDGIFDAGEVSLAGRIVYLDQNQNGDLDADEMSVTTGPAGEYVFQHLLDGVDYHLAQVLPPGWEETASPATVRLTPGEFRTDQDVGTLAVADVSTYTQSSTKNLRDNGTVVSTLDVTDTHNILDLNVKIDITHTNDEDLYATLISPAGTRVPLFYRVGGTGDNFTDTVFDDQATTPIGAGTAPFTGSFIPESPLGDLANESVNGTWGLEIRDYTKGNRGTLNYWSLEVTHLASGPVNTPPTAVNDSDTTSEDTSVTIDVLANDSDPDTGDVIQVSGITQGSNGSVADNGDGTLTYTPNLDFNGVDTFTYTISDGNGGFDTATVTVNVIPVQVGDFLDTNPMVLGPADAEMDGNPMFFKDVAISDNGDAMAVWVEGEGVGDAGPWIAMASHYEVSTGEWAAPVVIPDGSPDYKTLGARVVADGQGNYLAVIEKLQDPEGNIWANRYVAGSGWQQAQLVGASSVGALPMVSMASEAPGVTRAVVMWKDAGDLKVNRLTDFSTGTWAGEEIAESLPSTPGVAHSRRDISMAANGDFMVIFADLWVDSATPRNAYYRFYQEGTGWIGSEALLEYAADDVIRTKLDMNSSGVAIATWNCISSTTGEGEIWAKTWTGGGWNGSAELIAQGAVARQQISISDNGEAVMLFQEREDGAVYSDAFARHFDGTAWASSSVKLDTEDLGRVMQGTTNEWTDNHDLAMDDSGNAVAVWTQEDGQAVNLWAARFDRANSTWATAEKIEDAPLDALRPVVAMNGAGDNQVIWTQSDGALYHIYAATIPEPGNLPPTAVDDVVEDVINEDASGTIDKATLLANDSDPENDGLTITSFGTPGNGTLIDNGDGTVTYTPNPDFNGTDTFTYTISDGNGGTDTATVSILVSGVDDLPVADAGGPYTVVVGGMVQLDASGSTDPDLPYGDSLTYAWDFDSDNVFDDAFDVSPTFDAAGLAEGTVVDVVVEVTDSTGNTSTAATTITVSPAAATGMHVADLDGTSGSVNRVKWAATVSILVEDGSGSPVSGATVQGTWSHGISSTASTDANGLATVSSGNVDKSVGSVTFQVTSISHAILDYDPGSNTDPDFPVDSDGTSIVVYQDGSTAAPAAATGESQSMESELLTATTTSSSTQDAAKDDPLFLEQHTEPVAARTTDETVVTTSAVDEAIGELDLDLLTAELLDDLALAVL